MSNWLDLPNNSNRFLQTYVKGFVDISGGKLIVRNDDASFNNRIFIGGDTSLNSRLYVASDATINQRLIALGETSLNGNLFVNYDVSMNSRLYVASDATINQRLITLGDNSLNSRLVVGSDATINKRLFTLGDTSLNGNLFVNYDVSMNSNLVVGSDAIINKRLLTLGDVSMNTNLEVGGDVIIGNGLTSFGDVIFKNRLVVLGDCKLSKTQFDVGNDLLIPSDNIRGGVNNAFGNFTYDFYAKTYFDVDSDRFLINRTYYDVEKYNFIYSTTDLSISGNITTLYDMSVNGNLSVGNNISISGRSTATSFETESDYRIKSNIQSLLDTSFSVDLLKPVTYINKKLNRQDIGFIAHEVQEQIPFLVRGDKDDNELQSINYNGIIGLLTKEIQDLKTQNKWILERLNKAGI